MIERPVRLNTTIFAIHGSLQRKYTKNGFEKIKRAHENRPDFKVKKIGYQKIVERSGELKFGEDRYREGEHIGRVTNPISMAWCLVGGICEAEYQEWKVRKYPTKAEKNADFWNVVGGENNFNQNQMNTLFRDLSHELPLYPNVIEIVGHHSRKTGAANWSHEKLMENCPWFDVQEWIQGNGLWDYLQERKVSLGLI